MYLGGNDLDKIMLRKAAIQSVALMLVVIMMSFSIKQYNEVVIFASNTDDEISYTDSTEIVEEQDILPVIDDFRKPDEVEEILNFEEPKLVFTGAQTYVSNEVLKKLGEQYMVIRKPEGVGFQVSLEDNYNLQKLKIIISGFIKDIPDNNYIGRVNGEEVFIGEPTYLETQSIEQEKDGTLSTVITKDYKSDPVNGITITSHSDDIGYSTYEFDIQFDHVYVHILYEDDYYYYIDLKRPREVYDKILVIDAGHGGKDPGAISKDDLIYEKHLNLNYLLTLKEYLDKEDIKVYYTRLKDETLFLRPRVTLANDVESDFFISIHCNSNNSNKPNGTEILYYDHVNNNILTKDMARIFSEEISKTIPLKNGGLMKMKGDDVFILNNATVPAIIVETGYLSNRSDLEYLCSDSSAQELAEGIYKGIVRAYDELLHNKQY